MPSTRRQKAKARKSREMDMMSDMDNLDVMLGSGNSNLIERELAEAIDQSSVHSDSETNLYQRDEYRNFSHGNVESVDKTMLGNPLKLSQMNSTVDCLGKWIP